MASATLRCKKKKAIQCPRRDHVVGRTVEQIFGYPDDLKFRSSMTLFSNVATDKMVFLNALAKYFDGEPDQSTIDLMKHNP